MKKFLIIACGLMASCLSASTLPDNIQFVSYEKIAFNAPTELFADQVILTDNYVVSDFVVQLQDTVQLQTFTYVAAINVMQSKGFYKPIDYECFITINPVANYDKSKVREKFRNELFVDNQFRIENIPRKLVF